MSNKGLWTILGVVIGILVLVGVIYWLQQNPTLTEDRAIDELKALDEVLDAGLGIPDVNPIADPLDEITPDVNPIEAANPFDDLKTNPFE